MTSVVLERAGSFAAPSPFLTPPWLHPPASPQNTFAPMLAMASRILDEAPSPMAIVQITALTPIMTPSIVSAVRIMFRRKALKDTRRSIVRRMWTVLWRSHERPITAGRPRPVSQRLTDASLPGGHVRVPFAIRAGVLSILLLSSAGPPAGAQPPPPPPPP